MASIPSQFSDPRLDELVQYWLDKRGSRIMPARADIKPAQMGSLLRLLNLIEVDHHPLRFRHRLVGSETIMKLGRDATGRILDESLYGDATPEILASLMLVVRESRPYRRVARLDWNNQPHIEMEAVELPLGENGNVQMILRGAIFRQALSDSARLSFTPLNLNETGP